MSATVVTVAYQTSDLKAGTCAVLPTCPVSSALRRRLWTDWCQELNEYRDPTPQLENNLCKLRDGEETRGLERGAGESGGRLGSPLPDFPPVLIFLFTNNFLGGGGN